MPENAHASPPSHRGITIIYGNTPKSKRIWGGDRHYQPRPPYREAIRAHPLKSTNDNTQSSVGKFLEAGIGRWFELQLEWVVNPASVFVEAAALVEGACEEDEEDHAGSLHGGYGVEGGREAESLGDHAAKQYTDPHAEIP